jgi:protein-tyrosine phosphatase
VDGAQDVRRTFLNPIKVVFVCLGNICRSPLAEGVFRSIVMKHGQQDVFVVDSAGTSAWHIGSAPDARMCQTAVKNGLSIAQLKGRQFQKEDLERFDYIFAMDKNNLNDILSLDEKGTFSAKVRLFREFDPDPDNYQVPDPYYGGEKGFDDVYSMVERTSRTLFHRLAEEYRLSIEY